jgi:hypothetical protein
MPAAIRERTWQQLDRNSGTSVCAILIYHWLMIVHNSKTSLRTSCAHFWDITGHSLGAIQYRHWPHPDGYSRSSIATSLTRVGNVACHGLIATRAMCLQDHLGVVRVVNYGRGAWHVLIRQVINPYALLDLIMHAS